MAKYSDQALIDAFNKLSAPVVKSLKKKIEDYLKTCDPAVRKCFYYDYKAHDQGSWFSDFECFTVGNNSKVAKYVYFRDMTDEVEYNDELQDLYIKAQDKILKIIKSEKAPFKFEAEEYIAGLENAFFIVITKDELAKHSPDLASDDEVDEFDLGKKIASMLGDHFNELSKKLDSMFKKYDYLETFDIIRVKPQTRKNSNDNYTFEVYCINCSGPMSHEEEEFMVSNEGRAIIKNMGEKFKSSIKRYLPSYFKIETKTEFGEFYYEITVDNKDKDKLISYMNESTISYLDKIIFESVNI